MLLNEACVEILCLLKVRSFFYCTYSEWLHSLVYYTCNAVLHKMSFLRLHAVELQLLYQGGTFTIIHKEIDTQEMKVTKMSKSFSKVLQN